MILLLRWLAITVAILAGTLAAGFTLGYAIGSFLAV